MPYSGVVDPKKEASDFIRKCRDRLTPAAANLLAGSNRRVPGLRREEVAMLAAISVDYYGQIERGDLVGVSDEVLLALANALQMDDAETAHLFHLAHAMQPRRVRSRRSAETELVPPNAQYLLDSITDAPAWIRNDRMEFLASNALGRALFSPLLEDSVRPANNARFVFLNPAAKGFFPDWDRWANHLVNRLRTYALEDQFDPELIELVRELSSRSVDFRSRWAAQEILTHTTDSGLFNHPVVGHLELYPMGFQIIGYPHLTAFAYVPEPKSESADRLKLLSAWGASQDFNVSAVHS